MLPHAADTCQHPTVGRTHKNEIAPDARRCYNASCHLQVRIARREVNAMKEAISFVEAIIAGMVGNYVCKFADDVVRLIIDRL